MEEIRNRVAESPLQTVDLEDFFPQKQQVLDVTQWCSDGLVREKEFRSSLAAFPLESVKDAAVAVHNPSEIILPQWIPALVAVHLGGTARWVGWCQPSVLLDVYYASVLAQVNWDAYRNQPVLLKGCGKYPVPESAYAAAAAALLPVAKSVMYGEACSSVPLFKNRPLPTEIPSYP